MTLGKSYLQSAKGYLKKYNISSIYVLSIKNKTEGIVLISETDDNVYLENITYNPELSKYSIGITVCINMIFDLIERGKSKIFFGSSGKNDYKHKLCNNSRETYSLKIKRFDIKSL